MDIKENFYSKLQQIREDYDQNEAEKKRKNEKYIKKRNKHGLKSDTWREKSDMINKKAVTGLDEEQLDELRGYQGRKGQKLLDKVQKRATNRLMKAADSRDVKSAKRNQGVANAAWERMKEK